MKKTFITLGIVLASVFAISSVPVNAQGQTLLDQLEALVTVTDTDLQITKTIDVPAITIGDHVITTDANGNLCIGDCVLPQVNTETEVYSTEWGSSVELITSALADYYQDNSSYPQSFEYYKNDQETDMIESFLGRIGLEDDALDIINSIPESVGTMIFYNYYGDNTRERCPSQIEGAYALTFDANQDLDLNDYRYDAAGVWHFYCVNNTDIILAETELLTESEEN